MITSIQSPERFEPQKDHLLIVTGLLVWTFALIIPSTHLNRNLGSPLLIAAFLLPLAVLVITARSRNHHRAVYLFLPSLLPAIAMEPLLFSARIYGAGAFVALCVATFAHVYMALTRNRNVTLAAARRPSTPKRFKRGSRLLYIHTALLILLGFAIAYTIYFHQPFREELSLSFPHFEHTAMLAIGLSFFVVWVVLVARHLVFGLGASLNQREVLDTHWYRFEADNTDGARLRSSLAWSLLIGIISAALLTTLVLSGR